MNNKITFSEGLNNLENVIEKLEAGEISLEDSIKLYKEGMELLEVCYDKIDMMEKEVEIIKNKELK